MITLSLDWREVLWWMQGGMAGSHIRWSVYEDMVNKVWPQCDEQERRNLWCVMRRDLGDSWRPDGWSGYEQDPRGEGPWKSDDDGYAIDITDADGCPVKAIFDLTPWMYFRQVLARFDPENQWAVTMHVHNADELDEVTRYVPAAAIIKRPSLSHFTREERWESDTAAITVRAYLFKQEGDAEPQYYINWSRRCAKDRIAKVEKIEL